MVSHYLTSHSVHHIGKSLKLGLRPDSSFSHLTNCFDALAKCFRSSMCQFLYQWHGHKNTCSVYKPDMKSHWNNVDDTALRNRKLFEGVRPSGLLLPLQQHHHHSSLVFKCLRMKRKIGMTLGSWDRSILVGILSEKVTNVLFKNKFILRFQTFQTPCGSQGKLENFIIT